MHRAEHAGPGPAAWLCWVRDPLSVPRHRAGVAAVREV